MLKALDNVQRGASTAPAYILLGNLAMKIDALEQYLASTERSEPTVSSVAAGPVGTDNTYY